MRPCKICGETEAEFSVECHRARRAEWRNCATYALAVFLVGWILVRGL